MAKAKSKQTEKIRQLLDSRIENAPQVIDLIERFFAKAGGSEKVAEILWEEFNQANTGGLIRQRIIALVVDALKFSNKLKPPHDETSLLTDDDLDAEIEIQMAKVQDVLQQSRPDGVPQAVGADSGKPS